MKGVMIKREPQKRMGGVTREQFRNDAQSVEIGSDAGQSDDCAISAVKLHAVGEDPAGEEMSDWTHTRPLEASYISTSASPFSTFMGYTATFIFGFCAAAPVFGSQAQPCQGQTTLPFSMVPWPSGPPRCRQMLSIAL